MVKKTIIPIPKNWTKTDKRTVTHISGAIVTLESPRADYAYNPRKFQAQINGKWIHQYQVTGRGQWISEWNSFLDAIAFVEKSLKVA